MTRWSAISGPAGPPSPSRLLQRGAASRRRSSPQRAQTPRTGTLLTNRFRLSSVVVCVLYRVLCLLVGMVVRVGGERDLEIVVLRHQLAILSRGGKRPQ